VLTAFEKKTVVLYHVVIHEGLFEAGIYLVESGVVIFSKDGSIFSHNLLAMVKISTEESPWARTGKSNCFVVARDY
jgi:hypothetical protein